MADTPDTLGRAVLGTATSPPTLIVGPVPGGETWTIATAWVCNDSDNNPKFTIYRTKTSDSTTPPPQVTKIFSEAEIQPRQTAAWGRGMYLEAGDSLYGNASAGSAIVVNVDGVKRTP